MGFYTHHNIRGLDTDHQIFVSQPFDHMYLIKCALHNSLCRYAMIFIYQLLLQGTAVYPNADRDIPFLGHGNHSRYLFFPSNVSGIDPDLIRSVFHGCNGHFIIKMNICHQGNGNLLLDLTDRPCGLQCRNGTAYDLASCLFQFVDLLYRGLYIFCSCIRHGLDQNGISSSDLSVPDQNLSGLFSFHVLVPPFPLLGHLLLLYDMAT